MLKRPELAVSSNEITDQQACQLTRSLIGVGWVQDEERQSQFEEIRCWNASLYQTIAKWVENELEWRKLTNEP